MKLTIEIDTETLTPERIAEVTRMLRAVHPHAAVPTLSSNRPPRIPDRIGREASIKCAGELFVRACNCDPGWKFKIPELYAATYKREWEALHPEDRKVIGRHFMVLIKQECTGLHPRVVCVGKNAQNAAIYRVSGG